MKSTLSGAALKRLCLRNVISTSLYWQLRKARKKIPINYKAGPFSLEKYDDPNCLHLFRFDKKELRQLVKALRIPTIIRLKHGHVFLAMEALCIMLRRLAYPNRLRDLTRIFNRDPTSMSRIITWMIKYTYTLHRKRITSINQPWILNKLDYFAQCCVDAGSHYHNLAAFIDGTARAICRPVRNQGDQYSGYKKMHVLKYQSILFPNGLIGRLDGPFNGRRHDAAILHLSKLTMELEQHFVRPDERMNIIYGDPGYTNQKFVRVGYKNYNVLNERQKAFNRDMSALRVSVEYGFGRISQQFAFVDFKKNQKLLLQPLKSMYYVAAILANCQICLRGSQVSKYFQCTPPTLSEYLSAN